MLGVCAATLPRVCRGAFPAALAALLAGCSADHRLGSVPGSSDTLLHAPDASLDPRCASAPETVTPAPLDVYMMLDAAQDSMAFGNYGWDAVASAVSGFAASPRARDISLGIQYFPLDADGPDCLPSDYATPAVEIALLPDAALAINRSLFGRVPFDPVTMRPALEGALEHAAAWAKDHPLHTVVVVLVSGGPPSQDTCVPDDVGACTSVAAAALAGTPRIPTFVVTMGTGYPDADRVAAAGGTGKALPVTTDHDVIPSFGRAMDAIREDVGCRYALPRSIDGGIEYDKVNLQIAGPDGGAPSLLLVNGVANEGECDPKFGGWYYDDAGKPSLVIACPATCASIVGQEGATAEILFGCDRIMTQPAH